VSGAELLQDARGRRAAAFVMVVEIRNRSFCTECIIGPGLRLAPRERASHMVTDQNCYRAASPVMLQTGDHGRAGLAGVFGAPPAKKSSTRKTFVSLRNRRRVHRVASLHGVRTRCCDPEQIDRTPVPKCVAG